MPSTIRPREVPEPLLVVTPGPVSFVPIDALVYGEHPLANDWRAHITAGRIGVAPPPATPPPPGKELRFASIARLTGGRALRAVHP